MLTAKRPRPFDLSDQEFVVVHYDRDALTLSLVLPDENSYTLGLRSESWKDAIPYLTRALAGNAELANSAVQTAINFTTAVVFVAERRVVSSVSGEDRARVERIWHALMFYNEVPPHHVDEGANVLVDIASAGQTTLRNN